MPVVESCDQTIWQSKTPVPLQGRVFSFRRLAAQAVAPLGMLAAGPLADRVFTPVFGAGRGLGLLITSLGIATLALVLAAALSPRLRRLEDEIPDAAAGEKAPDVPVAAPAVVA